MKSISHGNSIWFDLEQIPAHWEILRLKFLTTEPMAYGANEAALEDNPTFPRFIRITDVNTDGSLKDETFKSLPPETAEPYLLKDGDVLLARSGATVGKAFLYKPSWGKACFAGYMIRCRCNTMRLLPAFFYAYTQTEMYWSQVEEGMIQATIQNFSAEKYGDLTIPLPPLSQQRAIADYLDRETGRLDALVAAKERWLELLAEKRRALITQAVTRGLNPKAPLHDSGIPWLGQIPAHWETWKVAHFAKVGNGSTPSREKAEYWDGGTFPWLNSSVVNRDEVNEADQFVTDLALRECHLPLIPAGSILVGITGQGKTRGQAAILTFQSTINQHIAYLTPSLDGAESKFLWLWLIASYDYLRSISDDAGGTKGAITCEQLAELRIPLPPLSEQRAIVAHIASETAKLDALRSATERTITLLKERRAALISEAVTGGIPSALMDNKKGS